MKKVIAFCLILSFVLCFASCKNDSHPEITHIEVKFYFNFHKQQPMVIEDRETIETIAGYIEKALAEGQKERIEGGYYCNPRCMTLYYADGTTYGFDLYDSVMFTTSETETIGEGVYYLYKADLSEFCEYMSQVYPYIPAEPFIPAKP